MGHVAAPPHVREGARQAALLDLDILDTDEERDYDDLTAVAAAILQVPISLVSLVDADRQWFKSHHGLAARETPRDWAFCAHAINAPAEPFVVHDASQDERFSQNPLVTGEPHIRFYAGVALTGPRGLPMGTLCAIDRKPRVLTGEQFMALQALARQASANLQLRHARREMSRLHEGRDVLMQSIVHDICGPILPIEWHLKNLKVADDDPHKAGIAQELARISSMTASLREVASASSSEVGLQLTEMPLRQELTNLFAAYKQEAAKGQRQLVVADGPEIRAIGDTHRVKDVIQNLLCNGMSYGNGRITVEIAKADTMARISIQNDGIGFAPAEAERLFAPFCRGTAAPAAGRGLGLHIARELMTRMGGDVVGRSPGLGQGATFTATLPLAGSTQ